MEGRKGGSVVNFYHTVISRHTSQGQVKFTHTPLGKYFGCGRGRGWLLGLMVLETSSVATGTPSLNSVNPRGLFRLEDLDLYSLLLYQAQD